MSEVTDNVTAAHEPISTLQHEHNDLATLEISGNLTTDSEVMDGAKSGVEEAVASTRHIPGAGYNNDDSSVTTASDGTPAAETSVEAFGASNVVGDKEPEAPLQHTSSSDNMNAVIIQHSEPPTDEDIMSRSIETSERPTTFVIPQHEQPVAVAASTQEDANEAADAAVSEITKDELPAADDAETQPPVDADTTIVDGPDDSGEPLIGGNIGPESAKSDAIKPSINGVGSATDAEPLEIPTHDPNVQMNRSAELLEEVDTPSVEAQEILSAVAEPAVVEDTTELRKAEASQMKLEVSSADELERPVVTEPVAFTAPPADTASQDTPISVETELAAQSSLPEPQSVTIATPIDSTANEALMEETVAITEPEPERVLQLTTEVAQSEPTEAAVTTTTEPSESDSAEETAPVAEAIIAPVEPVDTSDAGTEEPVAEFVAPDAAEETATEEPKAVITTADQPVTPTELEVDAFTPGVVSATDEVATEPVIVSTEDATITTDMGLEVPFGTAVVPEAGPIATNDSIAAQSVHIAVSDLEPVTTETDPVAVAEPEAAAVVPEPPAVFEPESAKPEAESTESVLINVEPPSCNASFIEDPEDGVALPDEKPQTFVNDETVTAVSDEPTLEFAEESKPQEVVTFEEPPVDEISAVEEAVPVDLADPIIEPASVKEEPVLEGTVEAEEVASAPIEESADAAPIDDVATVEDLAAVEEITPSEGVTSFESAAPVESTPPVKEAIEAPEFIIETPVAHADEDVPVVHETSVEVADGEPPPHVEPPSEAAPATEETFVPVGDISTVEGSSSAIVEVVATSVEEEIPVAEEFSAPAPAEAVIPVVEEPPAPAPAEEVITVAEERPTPPVEEVIEEPPAPALVEDIPVVEELPLPAPVEIVEEPPAPIPDNLTVEEPPAPAPVEENGPVVDEPSAPTPVEEDTSIVEEPPVLAPVEEDVPVVNEPSVPTLVKEDTPILEEPLALSGVEKPELVAEEEHKPVSVEEMPVPEEQPIVVEETSTTADEYGAIDDEVDEITIAEATPVTGEPPAPEEQPVAALHEPYTVDVPLATSSIEETVIATEEYNAPVSEQSALVQEPAPAEGETCVFEKIAAEDLCLTVEDPLIANEETKDGVEESPHAEVPASLTEQFTDIHATEESPNVFIAEELATGTTAEPPVLEEEFIFPQVDISEEPADATHLEGNEDSEPPTALAETSNEIEEVAEQQQLATITALSVVTDIERPKSPWTPSYSVTTQGSGITVEEPASTYEEEDDTIPTTQTPEIIVDEAATIVPEIAGDVAVAIQSKGDAEMAVQLADEQVALDEVEEAHTNSPWTPSYSVTVQGNVIRGNEGLDGLEELPTSAIQAIEVEEESVSFAQEALVAGEISSSIEVIADARTALLETLNEIVVHAVPDPIIEAEVPQHLEQVTTAVETEPLEMILPEPAVAEEELEEEIELGSFIVEDKSAQLDATESAEERSGSHWTPSYSVTGLEPATTLENEVVTTEGELVEHGSFIIEGRSTIIVDDPETKSELLTPVNDPVDERPKSPWTPSYSVTKQGPGEDTEELDELEQLPGPVASVPDLAADEEPHPPVLITETRASIDEHVTTEEAPVAQETSQTFPVLDGSQKISKRPSLSAVDELNTATTTDTTEFTTLRIDIPVTNEDSRKRLESTTSSRFFPGGWFSSSPKVPEEGRTSLDVATGEFVNQLSAENTPTTALPTAVEEDREKKSRWCTIM